MTTSATPSPDQSERAAPVARSVAITLALMSACVGLYYLAPLDGGSRTFVAIRVAVTLLLLAATVWGATRLIVRSRFPVLVTLVTVSTIATFALIAFAATYRLLSADDVAAFNEPLGHTDALYFSLTTTTTVGFGDIAPVSGAARGVVMVQMLANVVVLGGVMQALFHTARKRRDEM